MELINRRYRLDTLIGSGGMGSVYRAWDRLNGQTVAVKRITMPPELLHMSEIESHTPNMPALALAHEFRTLSSLRHPHIVNVLDYGFAVLDADRDAVTLQPTLALQPYFSMELLDAPQPLVAALRPLSLPAQIDLIGQMLDALTYLHRRGIVHRDLKPENVLVTHTDDAGSQVRVVDFGLSIQRGAWHDTDGGIAGTPNYLAPEVLLGSPTTFAADLYAVGVMLYELFAGQHPFVGKIAGFVRRVLNDFPNLEPLACPPALKLLILQLLDKDPAARPPDAESVRRALYIACDLPLPDESISVRDSVLGAASFVGREHELARLRTVVEYGGAHLWLIGGESGVGKSRLLDELRTFALVRGISVVRGSAVAESGSIYALWIAPLRALTLALPDLTPVEAGVLSALIADIETLTGVVPEALPPMDTNEARVRLYDVIADVLRRQPGKTLILLEDIHWGGESLALLEALAPLLEGTPVTIFCTYRNDEAPDLILRFPDAADMQLERLSRAAIAELSEAMLGTRGAQPAMIDLVERESEGNVFFIVETMRTLAEEAGQLDLVGIKTLPETVFAGGMRHVIARRIERLPADVRALLDLTCVAGRVLDLAVLEHALGASIEPLLIASANAAVLEYRVGDGWRFAHDKLREYLLSLQSADVLVALHRRIAEGIEAVYPNDTNKAAMLVRHWHGARDEAHEQRYLLTAAHQAYIRGNRKETLEYYQRLYALLDDPNQLHQTLLMMGQIVFEISSAADTWHEATLYVQQAFDLAETLDNPDQIAETLFLFHSMARIRSDDAAAARCAAQLEALIPRVSVDITSKIYQSLGYMNYLYNQHDQARQTFERALATAIEAKNNADIEGSHYLLGLSYLALERYADAEPLFLAMIAASDQNGDVTHHRMALGFLYLLTEDYPRAERLFHEALVFNEHARHWARTATTYADLGLLAWLQGDIATADLHVQRVETMSARMDALNPNFQALRWAVDARRGSPEAMAALDALRREPGFGWGNREIAHTIIRRLERDGTLPPLSA